MVPITSQPLHNSSSANRGLPAQYDYKKLYHRMVDKVILDFYLRFGHLLQFVFTFQSFLKTRLKVTYSKTSIPLIANPPIGVQD